MLGREQVEVDLEQIAAYLAGQTVLVTGAGGSIGSELCRQIARVGPARLILVDSAETPLFEIERELVDERDFTPAVPVLVDVEDRDEDARRSSRSTGPTSSSTPRRTSTCRCMETNPLESVRNNVARDAGRSPRSLPSSASSASSSSRPTRRSNPQTVMGQSKAICEWIVESLGHRARHRDALRRRALRQRAQLVRLGDPDLQAADREGRAR